MSTETVMTPERTDEAQERVAEKVPAEICGQMKQQHDNKNRTTNQGSANR